MLKMKKIFVLLAALSMVFMLYGCGGQKKAECKVTTAELVDEVQVDQVLYNFEDRDIFKIVFDLTAAEDFQTDGVSPKDDNYREAVYKLIYEASALEAASGETQHFYGYWPKEADADSADEMTLFYLVPKGTALSDITYTLDGTALGDPDYQFSYTPK